MLYRSTKPTSLTSSKPSFKRSLLSIHSSTNLHSLQYKFFIRKSTSFQKLKTITEGSVKIINPLEEQKKINQEKQSGNSQYFKERSLGNSVPMKKRIQFLRKTPKTLKIIDEREEVKKQSPTECSFVQAISEKQTHNPQYFLKKIKVSSESQLTLRKSTSRPKVMVRDPFLLMKRIQERCSVEKKKNTLLCTNSQIQIQNYKTEKLMDNSISFIEPQHEDGCMTEINKKELQDIVAMI